MGFFQEFWQTFIDTPFREPFWFMVFFSVTFVITFTRHLFLSGVYHYVFFVLFRKIFNQRIINHHPQKEQQIKMEIWRSAITAFIFSGLFGIVLVLWQGGYTKLYTDWGLYPWWYHIFSLILAMVIHETYYYWLHRWMHRPKIYPLIHKWHHDSIDPNAVTAFSFHPIESVLQAIVLPGLILFLPMHMLLFFAFLFIMTISGTINHAGVEIYPKGIIGKWIIGATHHNMHHKQFQYNYGLYFTFWDRWMKTENPNFEKEFEEKTKPV